MNEYELLGKYAKTVASGKDMYIKKFNIPGLKKYLREYEQTLLRTSRNKKAQAAGVGTQTYLQEKMIFEKSLAGKVKL